MTSPGLKLLSGQEGAMGMWVSFRGPWKPTPPWVWGIQTARLASDSLSPGNRLLELNLELGENLWGDGSLLQSALQPAPHPHGHL